MKNKTDICDICRENKQVKKSVARTYGANGWEERIVLACEECFEFEELREFKDVEEEVKKVA